MPIETANPRERAFQIINAKNKVRLRNPSTGEFLHLSGAGMTTNQDWSWLGHVHQADTLKQRAKTRGEEWPFQQVPREQLEEAKPVGEIEQTSGNHNG